MQVLFFKAIKPPKAGKPGADKPGIQGDDVADDKPAHEHLRELADVLEQRQDEGGAPEGDEGGAEGAGAEGEGAAPNAPTDAGGEAPGGAGGDFSQDNVSVGDFVAFTAGDFQGSGKVTAVGEDGVTVADKSGRDHRVHWNEITGTQEAAPPGADDGAPPPADQSEDDPDAEADAPPPVKAPAKKPAPKGKK